jgi:NhaP-type Na+/H+ or K+/H+ antiporter
MSLQDTAILLLLILAFGLISRRISKTPISGPIIFVAFGWLFGGSVLGILEVNFSSGTVSLLAELALAMILFTDASQIDLKEIWTLKNLPGRLLGLGLPLTIVLGIGAAALIFPGLTLWEAALIGVILAPTDAALGQAVVTNKIVPSRVREALNVESGTNDGICVPVLAFCLAGAMAGSGAASGGEGPGFLSGLATAIGFAVIAGAVVALAAKQVITVAVRADWMTDSYRQITVFVIPLLAYTCADMLGGSGFIASFVAGVTLGASFKAIKGPDLRDFAENAGQILTLITWVAFGSTFVSSALSNFSVTVLLYALASLTLVRMLPVALCLVGTGTKPDAVGFIGWFGPRGLASIVFAVQVVKNPSITGGATIAEVVAVTIVLSVLLHGMTAGPGARWLGGRYSED